MHGSSRPTHFRFVSSFVTAALIMPTARLHSLRDNAAVTASRMLGGDSTCSRPRSSVIYTPCAGTSFTMSCSRRSTHAMSNDGASRKAGVAGSGPSWPQQTMISGRCGPMMIGEVACEGIVSASIRSSTERIAHAFSCNVLRIDGIERRL